MRLDFHGASVRAARDRIKGALRDQCPEARLDDARLVLSELVANSLRYARPLDDHTIRVGWSLRADVLRLSVTDGGSTTSAPSPQRPQEMATGGRGLKIVQALAERWGVDRRGRTTTVWAELVLR
jgi:anti-sigma regulatory factor (Ser/Thr protein kinase)